MSFRLRQDSVETGRAVHLAVHTCSKLQGIAAKANKRTNWNIFLFPECFYVVNSYWAFEKNLFDF
jgi:hypothetical protein